MKVRATAAASRHSNAVGKVELECTPEGLSMLYLEIGAYTHGYAPAAVTTGTRVLAPWIDVREVRSTGDEIHLSLTPALTPHHRLSLTDFVDGTQTERAELRRRRWLLWGAIAVALLIGLLALTAIAGGWSPHARQTTAFWIGCLGAMGLLALGLFAEKLWLNPGPSSEQVQSLFLSELRHFRPAPIVTEPLHRKEEPADLADLLHALPRSTTAVVIVLSATSLAGILTSNWIIRDGATRRPSAARFESEAVAAPKPAPPPPEAKEPKSTPSAAPVPSDSASPKPTDLVASADTNKQCQCKRADSVLWRNPFPRLSTLLIEQKLRRHKSHRHVELELGVVNNSNKTLKEISLLVQFFEGENKKETKEQHLYYEATLKPAQAIKWHVEARGDSFQVQNPVQDSLTEAQLASRDDFAKLLDANHRPVRLHGAMMLAYLGDERAKVAATGLREALRDEEAPYLDRLLLTQKPTVACDLRIGKQGRYRQVELCAYNGSPVVQSDLGIKLRALDSVFDHRNPVAPPPVVLAEKVWRLPGEWAPKSGRWLSLTLDTDTPSGKVAETVEAFVDRRDALY